MGGKGSGGYRKNALPKDKNPLLMANDPDQLDPSLNSKVIRFMKAAMDLGNPDFSDPEDVQRHFYAFLETCERCGVRPMIGSYAASMSMLHQELLGVVQHDPKFNYVVRKKGLTPESVDVIQKSYDFLKISWETSLMDEKGNPVKWIFLGKNYFSMKDQSEKVNYNVEMPAQLPKPEDVAEKYKALVGRQEEAEILTIEDVNDSDE